jgi:hypothetical protein
VMGKDNPYNHTTTKILLPTLLIAYHLFASLPLDGILFTIRV